MKFFIKRFTLKKVLKFLASYLYLVLDSIIEILLPKLRPDPTRICLIRTDHIGDFLLWYGQAEFLRSKYPRGKFKIIFLCNDSYAELLKFDKTFDEIWPINRKRFVNSFLYRFITAKKIRNGSFGVSINPIYSRELFRSDALIKFSGSIEKIGFCGDNNNIHQKIKRITNRFYTQLIDIDVAIKNELEINNAFTKALGIKSTAKLAPVDYNKTQLNDKLKDVMYFVIAPGASLRGRVWPAFYFTELIQIVAKTFKLKVVILGALSDTKISQEITKNLAVPALNFTGSTNLLEAFKIISEAEFLITSESAAAHIGPITNTPTICLSGGGHFDRFICYEKFFPNLPFRQAYYKMDCYGCNWDCIYNIKSCDSLPCIKNIEVRKVFEILLELYP